MEKCFLVDLVLLSLFHNPITGGHSTILQELAKGLGASVTESIKDVSSFKEIMISTDKKITKVVCGNSCLGAVTGEIS